MNEPTQGPDRHLTLAQAQALLLERRAALRRERETTAEHAACGDRGQKVTVNRSRSTVSGQLATSPDREPRGAARSSAAGISHSDNRNPQSQIVELVAALPAHLGWGSTGLTMALKAAAGRRAEEARRQEADDRTWIADLRPAASERATEQATQPPALTGEETVPLPPALGLAILKQNQAASGRLWLLLRLLDRQGRGWISAADARATFTGHDSPLRFCGKRHLRGLLAGGTGLFWTVQDGRIWLRSAAGLALELGTKRFKGRDVALPVRALLGGIGKVRAHLYAAFHSGRKAQPIARRTLARKSGVAPRTQRHYDRQIGLQKTANYAIGAPIGSAAAENMAVAQGPAAFVHHERHGATEQPRRFLAWQLPNSYHGPHAPLGRGRQKRHNKALAGLLTQGTAGNDQSQRDDLPRRFFAHARAAAAAYGRTQQPLYWPAPQEGLWHCLWRADRATTVCDG